MKFTDVVKHDGKKIIEVDDYQLIVWIKEKSPKLYGMLLDDLALWSIETNQGDNITKELRKEMNKYFELATNNFLERRKLRFFDD